MFEKEKCKFEVSTLGSHLIILNVRVCMHALHVSRCYLIHQKYESTVRYIGM